MKNELMLLIAMILLACTASAQNDFSMDSSREMLVDIWDGNKYNDKCFTEEKEKCDKDKEREKCFDKCYEKCFYIQKCHKCGEEHNFDLKCDKCGEICKFFKSCQNCGIEYASENAGPYCDKCDKECNWLKVCYNCGDSHKGNGYCDKCGEKCYYDKCCYTYCDKYCYKGTECKENCPSCGEIKKQCYHSYGGKDFQDSKPMMPNRYSMGQMPVG